MTPVGAVRLKHVTEGMPSYGVNVSSEEYLEDGFRLLRTTDITDHGELNGDAEPVFVDRGTGLLAPLRADDILLSRSGTVGRALRVREEMQPVTHAGYLIRFTPDQDRIDPRFLEWAIRGQAFQDQVTLHGIQSTIVNVNAQRYASMMITHQPLQVQRLIADFLDRETHRIDALVDAKRRMIALLEEKRAGIRERLLGELGQESGAPLKRQADVTVGIVVQPARLYSEDGVPVLRGLNVGEGKVTQEDLRFISEEANREHSKSILLEGDVVVVRTGQAGAAAVVPPWAVGGNCVDLLLVHPSRSLNSKYLEYWLNSSLTVHQVEKFSVGAIQSHYNVGALRELLVAIPPLDEQRRIVQELDRREGAIAAAASKLRTQLDLLAEYRQALITQAVTGQLDEATLKGDKPIDEAVSVIAE